MSRFDPTEGLLAQYGLSCPTGSNAQLWAKMQDLMDAYLNLGAGTQGESFSYTQGDGGGKSITNTRGNQGSILRALQLVKRQLGLPVHNRALGARF